MIEPFERLAGYKAENDIDVEQATKLVKRGSAKDQVAKTTSATDGVIGVAVSSRSSGERIKVMGPGFYEGIAEGSISQGDRLVPSGSTDGAVTASDDVTETFVGYAREAASDGDKVIYEFRLKGGDVRKFDSIDTGSEGDQTSDAFDVDFTQNLAAADDWLVEVYDNNMDASSNVQISSQGSGSLQTAGSQDSAIAQLASDGTETLRFTDSSGSLSATVHVVCTPLNGEGVVEEFDLTYS